MTGPHLVFDITGHGLGHGAMSAPVVDALHGLRPDVRVTIRTSLDERWLRGRIAAPFDYVAQPEIGMVMKDGLAVDREASFIGYRALHQDWPAPILAAAAALAPLRADLLVSNVGYLSLAAARRLGTPAIAYCSLNWADVFLAYCAAFPGAETLGDQIAGAYAAADVFLQPAPAMAMPSVFNGRPTAAVARRGQDRSAEIRRALGLDDETRLALISFGGIAAAVDFSLWPRWAGWRLIVTDETAARHAAMTPASRLGMDFVDLIASADLLVIKPGYGLVTEAAVNGTPALYVSREGWPEEPAQIAWLAAHGRCAPLTAARLRAGDFQAEAEALIARAAPTPPRADGAREIAEILARRL